MEYSGKISSSVKFDYFPYPVSDKSRMTGEVLQEICPICEEWKLLRELSYLEVEPEVLWRPFETLSNGEQTKALLAGLSLNRTDIEVQSGNFSSWMENFERQQGFEAAQNERLKKDIRRLQQIAKRTAAWPVSPRKTG